MVMTLPPSTYPKQEDYGKLCLEGKDLIYYIHQAFLHGRVDEATKLTGDLFRISYDLLNLSCQLRLDEIERSREDHAKRNISKEGNIDEAIGEEAHSKEEQKGFYEAITPGRVIHPNSQG